MKNLDKMTKEELKEAVKELRKKENDKKEGENKMESELEKMAKEIFKGLSKKADNDYKESEDEIRKGFEDLFKDSSCITITTDRGSMAVGSKPKIMTCICMTIQALLDTNKLTMQDVNYLFEAVKEQNKGKEENFDLDEMLEKINEILGD